MLGFRGEVLISEMEKSCCLVEYYPVFVLLRQKKALLKVVLPFCSDNQKKHLVVGCGMVSKAEFFFFK